VAGARIASHSGPPFGHVCRKNPRSRTACASATVSRRSPPASAGSPGTSRRAPRRFVHQQQRDAENPRIVDFRPRSPHNPRRFGNSSEISLSPSPFDRIPASVRIQTPSAGSRASAARSGSPPPSGSPPHGVPGGDRFCRRDRSIFPIAGCNFRIPRLLAVSPAPALAARPLADPAASHPLRRAAPFLPPPAHRPLFPRPLLSSLMSHIRFHPSPACMESGLKLSKYLPVSA